MRYIANIVKRCLDRLDQPLRLRRYKNRGIALLMAIVTIALLATSAVEYSYSTRVNLSMSSRTLDELRAHFHARSGFNISRLIVMFQFSLQREARKAEEQIGRIIQTAMRRSNFQIHQYMDLLISPFNNGKLESPVGGIDFQKSGVKGFGNEGGKFEIDISPEEGKINLNEFARGKIESDDLTDLCTMVMDDKYDEIFQQKGTQGERLSRQRVLANIVDFIDTNEQAMTINENCRIESNGGDEKAPYRRAEREARPRNAKLTHPESLHLVEGVTEPFMRAFGDQFTVYPVGQPNINSAKFPIFFSVLCQSISVQGVDTPDQQRAPNMCFSSPKVRLQVMYFALALDGVRQFHSNPMRVLMAYVGSTQAKLIPSAKKGQPIAFRTVSQLPKYLKDFKRNPKLMANFIVRSPAYRQIVEANPDFAIDRLAPQFPKWVINFQADELKRSVSAHTPRIYRITSTGKYGAAETKLEAVVDFGQTMRRLPQEKELEYKASGDNQRAKRLKKQLRKRRRTMPRGRILYWRQK